MALSVAAAAPLCSTSAYPLPIPTVRSRTPFITPPNGLRAVLPIHFHQNPKKNLLLCRTNKKPSSLLVVGNDDGQRRTILQAGLWFAEAAYILWLLLLPYAPGDPVWAISSATIDDLIALSLNFFFILPFLNAVGIHLIEAPIRHPMSEGLFNFVIGWTFMFAPLLYTDLRRERYKGSIDVLWGFQMFLTNTFLIPYMAIRMNDADADADGPSEKRSQLGNLMTKGAPIVGTIGGAICLISVLWAFYGRMDGNFGGIAERWKFLLTYVGSERLAYAFIWDVCLYTIFQPWLIGANLQNVRKGYVDVVKYLRFVPVIGLVAYLLSLEPKNE